MLHHVVDGFLDSGDLLGLLIGDLHPELLLEFHDEFHQIQRVSLQILAEGSVGCDVAFINSQPVGGDLLYLAEYLFAIQDLSPLQGSYKLLRWVQTIARSVNLKRPTAYSCRRRRPRSGL